MAYMSYTGVELDTGSPHLSISHIHYFNYNKNYSIYLCNMIHTSLNESYEPKLQNVIFQQ